MAGSSKSGAGGTGLSQVGRYDQRLRGGDVQGRGIRHARHQHPHAESCDAHAQDLGVNMSSRCSK